MAGSLDGARMGLEHEVERPRFGEGAPCSAIGAHLGILELVEPPAGLAVGAVDEGIGEVGEVTRGLPDLRRAEDGGVEADDVVAELHHRAPPGLLDVAEQEHAHGAVVVGGAEPAVDLGGGEHEPAPLREVDDLVEQLGAGRCGLWVGGRHGGPRYRRAGRAPASVVGPAQLLGPRCRLPRSARAPPLP